MLDKADILDTWRRRCRRGWCPSIFKDLTRGAETARSAHSFWIAEAGEGDQNMRELLIDRRDVARGLRGRLDTIAAAEQLDDRVDEQTIEGYENIAAKRGAFDQSRDGIGFVRRQDVAKTGLGEPAGHGFDGRRRTRHGLQALDEGGDQPFRPILQSGRLLQQGLAAGLPGRTARRAPGRGWSKGKHQAACFIGSPPLPPPAMVSFSTSSIEGRS